MSSSHLSPRFVVFVVVSLITHLLELAASGLLCHSLLQQDRLKTPWFSLAAGLLIIPMVAVQLVSAVLLLRRKGETSSTYEVTATAVLHVLQLGFISRHFAVLQESADASSSKRAEVSEMLMLRTAFALTSGCSLLLLQAYLLFAGEHESGWTWSVYVSGLTSLVSITWALATFRRRLTDPEVDMLLLTWPGTALKILWRGGEIITRIVALALFTSLYTFWLFLVLGLHWLAMLICVCVPIMTSLNWRAEGGVRRTLFCVMTSYAYIFSLLNTSSENAVFRYTFYYVVLFLENSTLIAVWLIQSTRSDFSDNSVFVYVAAVAFFTSIVSMILYYKFFHIPSHKTSPASPCSNPGCITCKLGSASSHPPIPPRPGPSGAWLSQYHTAVYCGQYYKHNVQDSLLDSISEMNSTATASSTHARLQRKLSTIQDEMQDCESGGGGSGSGKGKGDASFDACSSSISNVDQRTSSSEKLRKKKKKQQQQQQQQQQQSRKKQKGHVEVSESEISSIRTDVAAPSDGSGSQKRPVWLPSGDTAFASHLLTYSLETFDTADTADDERSSIGHRGGMSPLEGKASSSSRVPAYLADASVHRSGDHNWYSDGYSTDRTLDWPKLPLTSLQRNMWAVTSGSESEGYSHRDHPRHHHHHHHHHHHSNHGHSHHNNSCECSHGDSEVSSIMRSIDQNSSGTERTDKLSPRANAQDLGLVKSRGYHGLHRRREDGVGVKVSRHDKQSSRNIKDVEGRRDQKLKSDAPLARDEIFCSPGSDPTYGPKTKRKHSPRRKMHSSTPHNKSTSVGSKSKDRNSITPTLPHTETCSDNSHALARSLAQGDKLASELLKKASTKEKKNPAPTPSEADPRFSVRVMTSQTDDTVSDAVNTNDDDSIPRKDTDERTGVKLTQRTTSKTDDTKTKVTDTYVISKDVILKSAKDKRESTRHDSKVSDGIKSDSRCSEPSDNQNSVTVQGQTEVIYENIWQVKKGSLGSQQHGRLRKGVDNAAFVGGVKHSRTGNASSGSSRDAWYVCSESEDSALPPEALSSSVDGFTASENDSDASMEIVI